MPGVIDTPSQNWARRFYLSALCVDRRGSRLVVAAAGRNNYLSSMPSQPKKKLDPKLIREWTLPGAATLGSSVRARGILLEVRARLPGPVKRSLDIDGSVLALKMVEGSDKEFLAASTIVSATLEGIENLPVIPREIQDILAISTTERHRWLKDGRLPSAGTRTVKLRGRARKITFHVFDPRKVEDILDRDLVDAWREQDAETAAENRRRAAWKAKLTRAQKTADKPASTPPGNGDDASRPNLVGWEEFERDGPLRASEDSGANEDQLD